VLRLVIEVIQPSHFARAAQLHPADHLANSNDFRRFDDLRRNGKKPGASSSSSTPADENQSVEWMPFGEANEALVAAAVP